MTQEVTEEMLMALADGELDAATSNALLARIGHDPDLARRYAPFASTRAQLRDAFSTETVPDALIASILAMPAGAEGDARVIPFTRRRAFFEAAIAASLTAVLFGAGGWMLGARGVAPAEAHQEIPLSTLAILATGETSAGGEGITWRALGSYEAEGGLCRVMLRESPGQSSRSVLCEEGGAWSIALTVATPADGGYIPASDAATALLDQYLDLIGAGAALSPDAEKLRLDALPAR